MSFDQLLAMVLDPDLLERYGPRFVDGLLVTAKLVAISFTLGAVLGTLGVVFVVHNQAGAGPWLVVRQGAFALHMSGHHQDAHSLQKLLAEWGSSSGADVDDRGLTAN